MAIGTSLFLTALGLILWLAVRDSIEGVDLETVGMILFAIGIVGLVAGLWMSRRRTPWFATSAPSFATSVTSEMALLDSAPPDRVGA